MKTLSVRINFLWDDNNDIKEFKLTVPSNVSTSEVIDVLEKEHKYLDTEDTEEIYGFQGRTPGTLLDYVCEKYGWSWDDYMFDIDIDMN